MRLRIILSVLLLVRGGILADAASNDEPPELPFYKPGDAVPVSCLNRSIENGDHIQDPKTGQLQYIPFMLCNETNQPLALPYLGGEIDGWNCTVPEVTDAIYHLFEFYVHHDTPLSCRVPARPLVGGGGMGVGELAEVAGIGGGSGSGGGEAGAGGGEWIPLTFALAGKLELSHLHISTRLNLLLHVSLTDRGVIDSAAAYSTDPASSSTRIVIGDPLPLQFRVRWYATADLPIGGGLPPRHGRAGQTLIYCLLSAIVGAVGSYAWVVGVDVPRRIKRVTMGMRARDGVGIIGNDSSGFGRSASGGGAGGKGYGGYGFPGIGNGNDGGYGYGGKRKD